MLRTFAACIVLLITDDIEKIQEIVIDREYHRKEGLIKEMIIEMLEKQKLKIPKISFQSIGKKSNAHYIAYGVFKDKMEVYREPFSISRFSISRYSHVLDIVLDIPSINNEMPRRDAEKRSRHLGAVRE